LVKGATLLGRYRLDERLAVGGMGTVYAATDERLNRGVAVKVLKDELAVDPLFVERFKREARAVAALSHPNIANVFDYGEDDGCHFIVMENVEGKDLARVLREDGALSPERVVTIMTQVCEAIGHAHAGGVIHRDVKPANIIVTPSDGVKVTDFGIARATGESTLTHTGSVLGSAQYISPEHAGGERVTPASDIYSLGVVLYEALTGSVPFTADSPIAVAMRHISDDMPAPTDLKPELPPAMDGIVARATAKDPRKRYRDPREMADELRAAIGADVAAATAVLSSSAGARTEELTDLPLVLPTRFDPQKLGAVVLIVFGALLLLAAGLLAGRVMSDDDRRPRRDPTSGAGAPVESETESETPVAETSMPGLIGENVDAAESVLKGMGLKLKVKKVEDFAEGFEAGQVFATEPDEGTALMEGQEVILYYSAGDGDDDEEFVPPGHQKKEDKEGD
jgi:eukaryotic-like serine/threonine-protein kinase